jgi:hypothetical protein
LPPRVIDTYSHIHVGTYSCKGSQMAKQKKIEVAKRALIARVNRKLAQDDRQLKASRSFQAISNFGDFYVIDVIKNFVVDDHIDLSDFARELGVLAEYETLVE